MLSLEVKRSIFLEKIAHFLVTKQVYVQKQKLLIKH